MINKCHNWQVTRTQCYAGDGSDRSEPRQTLQRRGGGEGGLFVVWTLTPPTATDRGGAHPVSCGSLDRHPPPTLCTGHSAPRLPTCFSARPMTPSTELKRRVWPPSTPLRWQGSGGASTDLHGQAWPAGGLSSSQPTLFVLYCTHQAPPPSPCLTRTPSLDSEVEKPCRCMYLTSVQMHLFEKENETLTYL